MDITISEKPAVTIAGLAMEATAGSDFSGLWQQFENHPDHGELAALGPGQYFGVCAYMTETHFIYIAGVQVTDPAAARELGFTVIEIPAAQYAVVPLHGPIPDCIHTGWNYVMGTFLAESGYRHADTPDFEVYLPGDMYAPDYQMQLWVPVVGE